MTPQLDNEVRLLLVESPPNRN